MNCNVIAIGIQKGGCGKTTTTQSLGASLARHFNQRVLVVDLEPTGNLTFACGVTAYRNHENDKCSVTTVEGEKVFNSTTLELLTTSAEPLSLCLATSTPGVSIVASDPLLSASEQILTGVGKSYRLKERLELLRPHFDFILIDTPPSFGVLTINALTAADFFLVPLEMAWFSLQGIGLLNQTIKDVRKFTNPNLKDLGFLRIRYASNSNLTKGVDAQLTAICDAMDSKVLQTKIRKCDALGKAQGVHRDIFSFDARCNASIDYQNLAQEVIEECIAYA